MLKDHKRAAVRQAIRQIGSELKHRGITVKFGHDFHAFNLEIKYRSNRHELLNQFHPNKALHKAHSAFWICGYTNEGSIAFTQAELLLDLRLSSVADFLQTHRADYVPASPPVDEATIQVGGGPRASALRGWVGYSGETWLHPEFRDKGTPHLVVLLGALSAYSIWGVDAIFGLMNWALVSSGFNNRVMFMNAEQRAITWKRADNGNEHQVWLVYLENQDIHLLVEGDVLAYYRFLSNKNK